MRVVVFVNNCRGAGTAEANMYAKVVSIFWFAFAITMPSFSEALKKVNGSLYPFGFLHIMRALRKNNRASFYLIGIDPAYQNKGVTAILFDAIQKMFNAQGITDVETNPELEENNSIQLMWKNYEHELHKRRRTYKRVIS